MVLKVGGDFSKLPALEARYHRKCYVAYIKPNQSNINSESPHEVSFKEFITYFQQEMNNGKALNMTLLTEKYRDILRKQNYITEEDVMSYRTSKLKARLENHFGDRIIFVNKSQKNESQVVFSSDVELEDVINIASEYKQSIADTNFDFGDGNIPHIIENNI